MGYIDPIPSFHYTQYQERIRNQMARSYRTQSIQPVKMKPSFQRMLDEKIPLPKKNKKKQPGSAKTEKANGTSEKKDLHL
ncbi:MAG: hypothetical protein IMW92_11765 [Bacillales bacterium]|nr:hypothetical protein [Bacillales bacterium]